MYNLESKSIIKIIIIFIIIVNIGYGQFEPSDPQFQNQWGHTKVKVPEAWEISKGQREIVVAVIGTGVYWSHEDLVGKIWNNSDETNGNNNDDDGNGYDDDIRGYDFVYNDNDPQDFFGDFGHETLVAGIIAADIDNSIGIAG